MKKTGILSLLWSGLKLNLLQASWNFERLQNMGFLFSISNMLKNIYSGDKENFLLSVKRHAGFFNTHIFFSSAVLGVMTRLEEEIPNSDPGSKDEEIENTKMGMMGPLAAIGDSLFWSGIKPLALLTGVGIVWLTKYSVNGWIAGCTAALIIYNLPRVAIKYFLLFESYYKYKELFVFIQRVKFQDIMKSIKVAGMGLLGAVMAVFLSYREISLDGRRWLDSGLMIAVFFAVAWTLRMKKSVLSIFTGVIVISILAHYIF